MVCEDNNVLVWGGLLPGQRACLARLLFPLQSLGQSPSVPVKVTLLGKLPSVFIFAADFHLSLRIWMFPDPGIFKHSYLSFLIMGCLHFPCVLFVSLVVWCRGLEWEG